MRQRSLDELRVNGLGRYLPLRAGLTHVIEEGQDDQAAILLVHGATVPAWEFDRLIPHLRAAGWRTIRFDLFGHGLSDRPAVRYDFSFFLEQALEVLDGITSHRPLTLLGHSFGAALAAAMASRRPERIERLVLVAPLLDFMANSFWGQIFSLPGIGGLMMRRVGLPVLERRRARRYQAIGAEDLTWRFVSEARAPIIPGVSDPVSDPVVQLLRALLGGPLPTSALLADLSLKHRHSFRTRYLRPAMEGGWIEPTLPDKLNNRLQRYHLTAAARPKHRACF